MTMQGVMGSIDNQYVSQVRSMAPVSYTHLPPVGAYQLPAGIGIYRSNDAMLTFGYSMTGTEAIM